MSLSVRRIPRGVKFFFKPMRPPTTSNAFFRHDSVRKPPSSRAKRSSDAFCSGVTSRVSHVPLKDVEQLLRNGDALSRSRFGRLHHFIPERV